jgi:putative endonuclease
MDLVRSIAALFFRFGRRSSRSPENLAHALGRRGEQLAAKHLRAKRYKVLYRNFRAPRGGEVDLVCRDKTTNDLVFVEVKTRRTRDFGDPAHAVNLAKQQLVARGALAWLRMLDNPAIRFRFDIVEVVIDHTGPTLKVIQNAFGLPEPYLY